MNDEQRDRQDDDRAVGAGGTVAPASGEPNRGSPAATPGGPEPAPGSDPHSPQGSSWPGPAGYGAYAADAAWARPGGGTATAERPPFGPGADPGHAWSYGPHDTTVLPVERPRRNRGMAGVVAAALIAGLVGGGAGFGGAYALLDSRAAATSTPALGSVPARTATAPSAAGSVAAAAATASPSTVDIRVTSGQGTAEGSGVILTADGAVLTNNHVVAGATGAITVTLADGSEHTATVVGVSPSYDLAVLRMQGVSGLPAATLGRSADVQVGQQVVAIGSPQGLTGTVTTGIISALNRTVGVQGDNGQDVVYNGLQTDAPINEGNSGGPLVNLDGQVIGINSAIATAGGQSSGNIGLGFAIPIDQARRVAQEILDSGSATKPVLGVQGGAPADDGSGAALAAVQDGSPAAAAGLRAGDVVTKVGDARVEDFADLVARIGAHAPGDKVTLTVENGGQQRTVDVTLGSTKDQAPTTSTAPSGRTFPWTIPGIPSNPVNPFGR